MRRRRAHEIKSRIQIVLDGRVPVARVALEDQRVTQYRCVIDDDIDSAEILDCQVDHGLGRVRTGDALREGDGVAADPFGRRLGDGGVRSLAVDPGAVVGDHHRGAVVGEALGNRQSHAARRAGDNRHPAVKFTAHAVPSSFALSASV